MTAREHRRRALVSVGLVFLAGLAMGIWMVADRQSFLRYRAMPVSLVAELPVLAYSLWHAAQVPGAEAAEREAAPPPRP